MPTVITVENLGKKYTLKHQQREQYTALRDVITNAVASIGKKLLYPFRSFNPQPSTLNLSLEDFWALRDVSFEVKQGDRIGIIGRNGAGKSTLLKILSRITEPTTGSVRIKGRVASLLEVGTGFHPELTGRENIFLNGAILGMQREEIRRKFDEIVDFAEIEKFLDTPVKRYSSGMYVRLAFAVAAHLEPEILIVDEVLAVGDVQFQKKCLGKMGEVGREGRTVLFVSHNMAAVSKLCHRAIILSSGRLSYFGKTEDAISQYIQCDQTGCSGKMDLRATQRDHDNRENLITSISILKSDRSESLEFLAGEDIIIRIEYEVDQEISAYCQINFLNYLGDRVMVVLSTHNASVLRISGKGCIECLLKDLRLLSGEYAISLEFGKLFPQKAWIDYIPEAIRVKVNIGNYLGGAEWINSAGHGAVAQKSEWVVRSVEGGW